MAQRIPTVTIESKNGPVVINEADFDKRKMKIWNPGEKDPDKKKSEEKEPGKIEPADSQEPKSDQ